MSQIQKHNTHTNKPKKAGRLFVSINMFTCVHACLCVCVRACDKVYTFYSGILRTILSYFLT